MSLNNIFSNCSTLTNITFPNLTTIGLNSNKMDIKMQCVMYYETLYNIYCIEYPDYKDTFNTILKLYNGNLALTIHDIIDFLRDKKEKY